MTEKTMDDNNNRAELVLHPVGMVRNELRPRESALELSDFLAQFREKDREIAEQVSELVVDPSLEGILNGIEDHSHLLVLYWPHLIPEERRTICRVYPLGRRELPERGVFATNSPARPNPILVTVVRLLERKDNVLRVLGLEALDGSPIIDIKPYVEFYHGAENPSGPQWLKMLKGEKQ